MTAGVREGCNVSCGKRRAADGVCIGMTVATLARAAVGTAVVCAVATFGAVGRAAPRAGCVAGSHTLTNGTLDIPRGASPGHTGLIVVVIPGGSGDPGDRLGVRAAAAKLGMAVLYPQRAEGGFWTLNNAQGSKDVSDVTTLLDTVLAQGCVDPRAITITGVSNGAGFATRVACSLPGRFAAVVPVAAGYKALDPCAPSERASFLDIHGTADTVVPYDGVPPLRRGSVIRFTRAWALRDGCTATHRSRRVAPLVTQLTWSCPRGGFVAQLTLHGTTHGWPGSNGPFRMRNPSHVSATRELIAFVRMLGLTH